MLGYKTISAECFHHYYWLRFPKTGCNVFFTTFKPFIRSYFQAQILSVLGFRSLSPFRHSNFAVSPFKVLPLSLNGKWGRPLHYSHSFSNYIGSSLPWEKDRKPPVLAEPDADEMRQDLLRTAHLFIMLATLYRGTFAFARNRVISGRVIR